MNKRTFSSENLASMYCIWLQSFDGQDGGHVDCGSSALCSNCATHGNLLGYFAVEAIRGLLIDKHISIQDRRLRYHPEDLDVFNLEPMPNPVERLFQFVYLAMIAILEPMPNPVERTFTPQPLPIWVALSPMMDITCLLLELLVIVMASSSIQCQDSYGPDFADNGYSLIYADLVTEYVEMTDGQDGGHVDCGSSALCSNCATHGNLRGYFAVKSNDFFIYLKEFGVLLEEECILDQPERVNGSVDSDCRLRYHPEDLDVFNLENLLYNRGDEAYGEFHSSIQNLLRGGQIISIRIACYDSYFGAYAKSSGKNIYSPTSAELGRLVPNDGHYLLAIGASRDRDGKLFYSMSGFLWAGFC
ncbi:hypothetical protein F2Q70_00041844 [Brassica cretica]|uniref:Uncharacterized protein n=1 Tax=Brassica cretica TaxID=69181 RepID=A0A8S9K804_BRACR|nr:hypothetical protein F2Q70_00041844 [Brassica cretica]